MECPFIDHCIASVNNVWITISMFEKIGGHVLYPVTAGFIALTASLIIVYDIWVVWRKGGDGTISWTLLSWWLLHPWVIAGVFALVGHLFFPKCLTAGGETQPVSHLVGSVIGVLAVLMICVEVFDRWRRDETPTVTKRYLWRLYMLAIAGMMVGHYVFGQSVVCR